MNVINVSSVFRCISWSANEGLALAFFTYNVSYRACCGDRYVLKASVQFEPFGRFMKHRLNTELLRLVAEALGGMGCLDINRHFIQ